MELVRKQDVLLEAEREYVTMTGSIDVEDFPVYVGQLLDKTPKYESPTGVWEYVFDESGEYDTYRCSNCGKVIKVRPFPLEDYCLTIDDMEHCPRCAAEMDL